MVELFSKGFGIGPEKVPVRQD